MQTLHYKSKQFFFVLIKLSLVVAAFYFIYYKLTKNNNLEFSVFTQFLTKNGVFGLKTISFLLFLSIFNWLFEILKWQELVSFIKKISFKKAIEQCLGSLTASLFTPNRIGEYGAKAIYFSHYFRKRIVLINLLGNLLQMAITVLFGTVGIVLLSQEFTININIKSLVLILLAVSLLLIFFLFIFKTKRLNTKRFSFERIKTFALTFPRKSLVLGFMFSLARYLIFSFQFYYVLTLFGVDIGYFQSMKIITSMYLLASIIPSIFIFDVVIKGSIAIYLFSLIGVNELIVLSTVTMMWILNVVLPSILGSYFVLQFKLPENKVVC